MKYLSSAVLVAVALWLGGELGIVLAFMACVSAVAIWHDQPRPRATVITVREE